MMTWEYKFHHSGHLPVLLPPALCAEHDTIWDGTSLWSAGISHPVCVPSQLLVYPQSPHWWGGVWSRKGLALCKCCSARTKTSLKFQHCYQHESKSPRVFTVRKINYGKITRKICRMFNKEVLKCSCFYSWIFFKLEEGKGRGHLSSTRFISGHQATTQEE